MGIGCNRYCCVMNKYAMYSAVNGAAHGLVLQSHTVTAIENTGFTSISTRHYMKNDDSFVTAFRPSTNTKQHLHTPDTITQFTVTNNYIRKLFTKQH